MSEAPQSRPSVRINGDISEIYEAMKRAGKIAKHIAWKRGVYRHIGERKVHEWMTGKRMAL